MTMWVVRYASKGQNSFCLVACPTRRAADLMAADQIKAWQVKFDASLQSARNLKDSMAIGDRAFAIDFRKRELASYLTAQVERETANLASVLRDGLRNTHLSLCLSGPGWTSKPIHLRGATEPRQPVDWSEAEDHSDYPVPAPVLADPEPSPPEPSRDSFLPQASFISGMVHSLREKEISEAQERFRAASSAWDLSRADAERRNRETVEKYQRDLAEWSSGRRAWLEEQRKRNAAITEKAAAYARCDPGAVEEVCRGLLTAFPYPCVAASKTEIALCEPFPEKPSFTEYPDTFPHDFELVYVRETRTAVVDYALPSEAALPTAKGYKYVATRDEIQGVPVSQAWLNETYDSVLYQVTLRTIYELFRWDEADALDWVVFNGWVNSIDKATGKDVKACVLTIQASKRESWR